MSSRKNTETCTVCYEKYNNCKRKLIQCPYCTFGACSDCLKKFLLSINIDPYCMNCKTTWKKDFYIDSFSKSFIYDEFKKHREEILLDKEKSLLPTSAPMAERVKRTNDLKKESDNLRNKVELARHNIYSYKSENKSEQEIHDEQKALSMAYHEADFELEYLWNMIRQLSDRNNSQNKESKNEEHKKFVRACPVNNCKGFLSMQWKCGMCNIFVCSKCHEVIGKTKDDPHTCKPESIATAQLLEKDSKSCPNCGVFIFRISGCNQMFCTNCHTPFDWSTGRVLNIEHVHNPHLIEWQQQHGNAHVDECGMPNYAALSRKCSELGLCKKVIETTCHLRQSIEHNMDIILRRYAPANYLDNDDLRIKYLIDELTETDFKRTIFAREKKESKKFDIRSIIEMFHQVSSDIIRKLYVSKSIDEFTNTYNEINTIVEYADKQMIIVGKRYKNKVPKLNNETFIWS